VKHGSLQKHALPAQHQESTVWYNFFRSIDEVS